MSVLASYEKLGSTELCYISTVKGAPETLRRMVRMTPSLLHSNVFYIFYIVHVFSLQNVPQVTMKSTKKSLGKVLES